VGGAEPSIKEQQKQRKETKAPRNKCPVFLCSFPPPLSPLSSFHLLLAQALPSKSLRNSSSPPPPLPNSLLPGGAPFEPSPEAAGSRGGGGAPANARAPLRPFLVIIYYYLPLPVASLVWVDRGSVYLSIGLITRLVLGKIGFLAAGPLGPRLLARRSLDRGVFLGVFRDLGVCGWVSWHRIAASFTAHFFGHLCASEIQSRIQ